MKRMKRVISENCLFQKVVAYNMRVKVAKYHISHSLFSKNNARDLNSHSVSIFSTYLKFIHSEKATKFCEIFTLLLTGTT